MPKNRSSRAQKARRQAQSRTRRASQNVPTWQEAMAAFEACLAAGAFPMASPDGKTRMLSVDQMCAHLNAGLAADGEPPVDIEELPGMFADDVTGGDFYFRPDGRWETTVDYFSVGGQQA